jgi:Fur family ferric uptake transcriptional regulator
MNAKEILKHNKLRVTAGRMAVLELFSNHNRAFSHSEMQQKLSGQMDRVTLYRILDSFEKKGILHKVPDDEVSVKYALCDHDHSIDHQHVDDHPHFKCHDCGETFCLEEVNIPSFTAPKGFKIKEQFLLLGGTCRQCA